MFPTGIACCLLLVPEQKTCQSSPSGSPVLRETANVTSYRSAQGQATRPSNSPMSFAKDIPWKAM